MMTFIIKSTVCLFFMYGFYYILLRNQKTFTFNRFYLLFSVILSITIPFINFGIGIDIPINKSIQDFSIATNGYILQSTIIAEQESNLFTIINIVLVIYFFIATILFIRLIRNLHRIITKIKISERVDNNLLKVVLVKENTLPYSFFRYIIVNKHDYLTGKIDKELLIHEQTHCEQYHSIDILFIELTKILMWYNPIIWILKKEIQLNHEYLADNAVILKHDRKDYLNLILTNVFRNNISYLASNFNYSLTKKRLIMITKNDSSIKSMVGKITIVPLVMLLGITLSFSQNNLPKESLDNLESEWWYPILKKHRFDIQAFNNFGDVFEMGTSNSINDRIVTLKDALFLIKTNNNAYTLIKSPLAYHDLDKNIIKGEKGLFETYSISQKDLKPQKVIELKQFEYEIDNSYYLKAEEAVWE